MAAASLDGQAAEGAKLTDADYSAPVTHGIVRKTHTPPMGSAQAVRIFPITGEMP